MVNCYSEEYLAKFDIRNERYNTKNDPDAKKKRDRLARELRKEGWTVETQKWDFPDLGIHVVYTLDAWRGKNDQVSLV